MEEAESLTLNHFQPRKHEGPGIRSYAEKRETRLTLPGLLIITN